MDQNPSFSSAIFVDIIPVRPKPEPTILSPMIRTPFSLISNHCKAMPPIAQEHRTPPQKCDPSHILAHRQFYLRKVLLIFVCSCTRQNVPLASRALDPLLIQLPVLIKELFLRPEPEDLVRGSFTRCAVRSFGGTWQGKQVTFDSADQ